MQIPDFPECDRLSVKSLLHHSDTSLLRKFQRYPEQGKYFTAIFCRYSVIVYTLIQQATRSPVQADYLFALTWRHIYYELEDLQLPLAGGTEAISFQNWLIDVTGVYINQAQLPPVELINYSLPNATPVLWCYLEQALDKLPPMLRLMVLMAQTFHWSETRIAAYLQAEGEMLSPAEVQELLLQGYRLLEAALPEDIREIYLGESGRVGEQEKASGDG